VTSDVLSQGSRPQIRAHIERELGPVSQSFREENATMPIEVLHVPSTVERPIHTLITAGMSDRPMQTGDASDAPRYLELMVTLPRDWPLKNIQAADPKYWPIRLLMSLARLPHERGSALGWGDIVPNGEPPQPYAPDTKLCGVILAPSLLVPKEFYMLDTADRHIEFFAAIPLFAEELALQREHGMKHVLTSLIDHRINDLVDIKRRNITRKRFGLF
jgi:hypothetical protein